MALTYGCMDDGNLELKYSRGCCCSSSSNGITKDEVKEIVADSIELKEEDDKLLFNGEVVAEDNYVKGGYYNSEDGHLYLNVGKDKDIKIDMNGMLGGIQSYWYVPYSGYLYPTSNKQYSIILDNDESLFGKCCDGQGIYNLATVNRKNVADIGSRKIPLNLQGLTERPKYNGCERFAFMSDVPDVKGFATKKWVQDRISDAVFGGVKISSITEEEIRSLL